MEVTVGSGSGEAQAEDAHGLYTRVGFVVD